MRWIGACDQMCACDKCWNKGDECGHREGTCALTPKQSFAQALAEGRVGRFEQ